MILGGPQKDRFKSSLKEMGIQLPKYSRLNDSADLQNGPPNLLQGQMQ